MVPLTRRWDKLSRFPSLLQLRLRIEVPLWRDLTTARHPNADLPAEEDSASDTTGSAERSPELALPVPVGLAEPPEVGTEEATEDEDMMAEPNCTFAKGYGRFGKGYTRLATALGNFEKLRVATLYGRLPTSPGSLAHNRLSHSSGTVRKLSLTLPNTSKNFKCCTSCSQTLAPFSHTSQTNWP